MGSQRARRILPWLVVPLLLLGFAAYQMWPRSYLKANESLNMLIVGIEGIVTIDSGAAVPDESQPTVSSVAVLSIHPQHRSAHLLLIPREIVVPPSADDPLAPYIEGRPLYELVDGLGADTLAAAVEGILDVPIHATFRTDVLSLRTLVHREGGLVLPVDIASVGLEGVVGNASQPVPGGRVPTARLSGDQVAVYVDPETYEHGATLLAAQGAVFRAGLQVIRSPIRMVNLEALFERGHRYFETDLDRNVQLDVAKHLFHADPDRIALEALPGRFEGDVFHVDEGAAAEMVQRVYVKPSWWM